jgi:hypothetical protein
MMTTAVRAIEPLPDERQPVGPSSRVLKTYPTQGSIVLGKSGRASSITLQDEPHIHTEDTAP